VKCSSCGLQVEISLMGEHDCEGSGSPMECTMMAPSAHPPLQLTCPLATPPLPATSLFGRLMPAFGTTSTQKQQPRAPPQLDTSAANRAYMGQNQLTPISQESGSQSSVSPQTPTEQPDTGKPDEYFTPEIANNSPPPPQSARLGGYGGLDDSSAYEGSTFQALPRRDRGQI
jgi:hypothetical protein